MKIKNVKKQQIEKESEEICGDAKVKRENELENMREIKTDIDEGKVDKSISDGPENDLEEEEEILNEEVEDDNEYE